MAGVLNVKYNLQISSSSGAYNIQIGSGIFKDVRKHATYLIDSVVKPYLPTVIQNAIEITGTEEAKTLIGCERVILEMRNFGVRRGDSLVAVGGGVIQDVATLSTSLYMRGIDWEYVPTTLMSMADSCIGGKSSINAGGVKNLVGNFHPPKQIIIDPVFLSTLPQQAITSGLAEAVKICFAKGPESFEQFIISPASVSPGDNDETANLIHHVLNSKKWFVETDEFDINERQMLNFGHSFGHAWESACNFSIQHGVAVAVGMLAALKHPRSATNDLTIALKNYCLEILKPLHAEISTALDRTNWEVFEKSLRSDKKNRSDSLRLILPGSDSALEIISLPLDASQLQTAQHSIQEAIEEILP